MSTVTNYDIRDHVILPSIGNEFDDETLDRILEAVLEVAPVSTWRLRNLQQPSTPPAERAEPLDEPADRAPWRTPLPTGCEQGQS